MAAAKSYDPLVRSARQALDKLDNELDKLLETLKSRGGEEEDDRSVSNGAGARPQKRGRVR